MMADFTPFPKIPRLFRDIVITEKIDGTNAAVVIKDNELLGSWQEGQELGEGVVTYAPSAYGDDTQYWVYAQSRKRIITPEDDNYGFAAWVRENAHTLAADLGPGTHFGEWWGHGIQRGYGLPKGDRRFSLFNVKRWAGPEGLHESRKTPNLLHVPVLGRANTFDMCIIDTVKELLRIRGSQAAPGFMRPEGIIVHHVAGNHLYKSTLEKDDEYKGS